MESHNVLAEAFMFMCGMIISVVIMAVAYAVGVTVGESRCKRIPFAEPIHEDHDDDEDDFLRSADWWKRK